MKKMTPEECLEYLEKNGGNLSKVYGKTVWPDKTVTDFVWQYNDGNHNIRVLGAKSVVKALMGHKSFSQQQKEWNKNRQLKKVYTK